MSDIATQSKPTSPAAAVESLDFPGWGTAEKIEDLSGVPRGDDVGSHTHEQLGEWPATAICGNDITSSCLYVSAICALWAGPLAPFALAAVAVLLYFFRFIYAEVGGALPLNGGAYNVLLNTTTKRWAAMAACLTLLSYVATAVISAGEALHYGHNLAHFWPTLYAIDGHAFAFWGAMMLLGVFAFLNLLGISESASVAMGIFGFHMITLTMLVLLCGSIVLFNPETLQANWNLPMDQWPKAKVLGGSLTMALFFGFSAAMLGVSGFESSANFIEEQEPGVFPKTLRNMWIAVAMFNPLISLLSLGMMPLGTLSQRSEDLLAYMGRLAGEHYMGADSITATFLETWVSIDAFLVLSGAVLTSYVGVLGLVRRMSLDLCMPQFLLQTNRWRGTNHWIILGFFLLCCSIQWITNGEIAQLAGVYTLSFLSVMGLFSIGNMLLKVHRDRLPRQVRASWTSTVVALVAVMIAWYGNFRMDAKNFEVFMTYFVVSLLVVGVMFERVNIMKIVLKVIRAIMERLHAFSETVSTIVIAQAKDIQERKVVVFLKEDDPHLLNLAARYVLENEEIRHMKVVHCYTAKERIPVTMGENLKTIDRCYPELKIDLTLVQAEFGPELIDKLSFRLGVPNNYMFIGTPGNRFPHEIADLGGVRLIM
jgi:amino acid transporter